VLPVAQAARAIAAPGARSLVSLSMDDGYRDNVTALLPVCQRVGVKATVYLESRPLDERRVNWVHKYFWILGRMAPEDFVHRFTELSRHERTNILLNQLVPHGEADDYHVKRMLKYEVPPDERDRAIDLVFAELGGDERALCDELYMGWDDARRLRDAGFELGGHTVHHEILARLDDACARAEVTGVRAALERELGPTDATFAYPFGRRWDYDERSRAAVREAGFSHAVTTHAGTNDARTEPTELKRLMIDQDAELHLLAAEACGGFDLLRRLGLDLSE
jgi:peptidoglycan/xylan/chitin deacetylase (PgdA/CDA1 family)